MQILQIYYQTCDPSKVHSYYRRTGDLELKETKKNSGIEIRRKVTSERFETEALTILAETRSFLHVYDFMPMYGKFI